MLKRLCAVITEGDAVVVGTPMAWGGRRTEMMARTTWRTTRWDVPSTGGGVFTAKETVGVDRASAFVKATACEALNEYAQNRKTATPSPVHQF